MDMGVCPECKSELRRSGKGEFVCTKCGLVAYEESYYSGSSILV